MALACIQSSLHKKTQTPSVNLYKFSYMFKKQPDCLINKDCMKFPVTDFATVC